MRTYHFILLFCLTNRFVLSELITCSPEPIASSSPIQSILHTWPRKYLEYVGDRIRLSTCTGVIWIRDNKLISIGGHNLSLDTYQFDPTTPSLFAYKREELKSFQQTRLGQLENLAISEDGSLVAVSNNGAASIHLYKIADAQLKHVAETPNSKEGWWSHGVRFSHNMDYLAHTLFGKPGKIMLFRILKNKEEIYFQQSQILNTDLFPKHPKALDFSIDDRFIVVCHAPNNTTAPNQVSGAITVYPFDRITGKIDPTPVSVIENSELINVPEDLCFYPDGSCFLVINHFSDAVTIHAFDQLTGKIGEGRILLQNPEAQLFLPHGLCISPNGKYLAVTNYGDDTVKIYRLISQEAPAPSIKFLDNKNFIVNTPHGGSHYEE